MTDSEYVTNAAWLRTAGRADAIDEVADAFERPSGAEAFWTERGRSGGRAMGRRSTAPLHRREGARLAG